MSALNQFVGPKAREAARAWLGMVGQEVEQRGARVGVVSRVELQPPYSFTVHWTPDDGSGERCLKAVVGDI